MEPRLVKIFCETKCDPMPDLADRVCRVIEVREERSSDIKFRIFSLIGLISLIGLLPAYQILVSDLSQSGFYDYFSLFPSGLGNDWLIFSYWRELFMSLLETLPVMSIILSLSLIFIFFLSLKSAIKQSAKKELSFGFGQYRFSI